MTSEERASLIVARVIGAIPPMQVECLRVDVIRTIHEAIAAEREACAKVAEEATDRVARLLWSTYGSGMYDDTRAPWRSSPWLDAAKVAVAELLNDINAASELMKTDEKAKLDN